jgi:hypothetical protein
MRWLFLSVFVFALAPLAAGAQEVIVFKDGRSLVVASHREQGPWTYLKVDGGELAVGTAQITQIRKEGTEAQQSAQAASKAGVMSPGSPQGTAGGDKAPPPAHPAPPPAPQPDNGDDRDDNPEKPPPPKPPSPARAMPPGVSPPGMPGKLGDGNKTSS